MFLYFSGFFWLLSLLLSSILWFAVVPLRDQLAFGVVFSVIFQEIFRFLFFFMIRWVIVLCVYRRIMISQTLMDTKCVCKCHEMFMFNKKKHRVKFNMLFFILKSSLRHLPHCRQNNLKFIILSWTHENVSCGTPISQLVEHEIGNLRVTSSSPALGTGRNEPPVHPAMKWVPGIWTLASWLFNQCL